MKLPSSINLIATRFHRRAGRSDVVRDPYTAWFRLCIIFIVLLVLAICFDFFVFYELQTGQLVSMTAQSQTPTPIIDQTQLTATAQSYAQRAVTLAGLEAGSASTTAVVDPSL